MIDESSYSEAVAEELSLDSSAYANNVVGEVDLTSSAYGEDVAEAINEGVEPVNPYDLRVMQLNVGHFSMGHSPYVEINSDKQDGYPSTLDRNYAIQLQRWGRFIDGVGADIMGMPEWSTNFGTNNGSTVSVGNTGIFGDYEEPNYGSAVAGGWWRNCLVSKLPMANTGSQQLGSLSGAHPAYAQYATVLINDIPVKIVVTHLNWSSGNTSMNSRTEEISNLIDWLKDEQYVILFGDFNTDGQYVQSASKTEAQFMSGADEFDPFITAGFTLALHGTLGDVPTCDATDSRPDHLTDSIRGNNNPDTFYNRPFCVLDNIIVKGFTMSNVRVLDTDVFNTPSDPLDIGMITDHCAVVCDLTMIEEGGEV